MFSDDWALQDLKLIAQALDRAIDTADISIEETDALTALQITINHTMHQLEQVAMEQ